MDVCLIFGNIARSLVENGQHARLIDKKEAMDVLERSYAANLVQIEKMFVKPSIYLH